MPQYTLHYATFQVWSSFESWWRDVFWRVSKNPFHTTSLLSASLSHPSVTKPLKWLNQWETFLSHLSHIYQFIFSERLSNSLWGSDVLLFSEFLNIVSILFYNFIEFIIYIVVSFSSNFFCLIQKIYDLMDFIK